MQLAELGELIAVKLSGDPWFDADIRFPDPRDLLDIFPGLLQVDVSESGGSIVSLAHFSVKEYLISERIKTQQPQAFWLPKSQSHEFIAATCLAYILHFDSEYGSFISPYPYTLTSLEKYPLMRYACEAWTWHARITNSIQGILKDLSLELLRRGDLRRLWFRGFHKGPLLDDRVEEPGPIPPLFIAASIGVRGIVQILLKSGHHVNERCTLGTALETAATQGHDSVLSMLLENGADPNLLGRDNYPSLQAAARFGTLESVKVLIESGAKMDDERGSFGSCLIAACVSSGRYWSSANKKPDFLLDKGANVHISSKTYGNALHAACAHYGANLALIEKLVSRGIEIDARGGKYGTALQAACAHSQNDQVIRFLLSQADPCIEVKESKYGTALQAICAESHDNDKLATLLLSHGAKKAVHGGKYGTVLHAACYQGNEKIVRLLLGDQCQEKGPTADQNLDINEVTTRYGTPLHAACFNQKTKIVRLLVELGANINVNVPELGTPLFHACKARKSAEIVKLLLAKGADVNIRRNIQPYTALEILLRKRHLSESQKKLRMLYEHGVLETGLSQLDSIRLEEIKKHLGISKGGGIVDRGMSTKAATGAPEISDP